jgi:hypothetical protein
MCWKECERKLSAVLSSGWGLRRMLEVNLSGYMSRAFERYEVHTTMLCKIKVF